ncbi:MAG: fumarylacetoacetate hydrolase family protein [Synergistaceae bacterium]|jgi:2-keto-4-pentenoate hydratase/2-oxohepta-3-ene-1,7-dioic acid hydratase in catechol pathway|nr:fumarylacetoacetate hydrolase family protein [Synergistaceae bacterium]
MIRDIAAPLKFCRFMVDGKTYNGALHGNMVDLVEGDFLGEFSTLRMSYPLERVKLLPPITPTKIWCVGRNYAGHAKELEHEIPKEPLIFIKATSALAGSGDPVRIPEWAGRIDYEGELAVVILKRCRKVAEKDALSYVAGYSCFNDVTARDLQNLDGQWIRSKSFDTFAPFGPVIVLSNTMPADAEITTWLNGAVMQRDKLSGMIFSVARIISHISMFATLEPGDVIATGTPEGIGRVRPGDRVEVEIDGIGTLYNPFILDH